MGVWFSVEGSVEVWSQRDRRKYDDIMERLRKRVGNEVAVDDDIINGDGSRSVSVSGGTYASYSTADDVESIIKELGPLAVEPARFVMKVDDDKCVFWVGKRDDVRKARRDAKLNKILAAIGKLPTDDRAALMLELSGEAPAKPLADSLSRVAFILHKIVQGDHKALDNAPDAIEEAMDVLEASGFSDDWFEQVRDE